MARKASGADQLASARELLRTAKTADELRTAQAVLLPLELGMSLEQTAKAIGRSIGATCNLRTRYCKVARHEREAPRPKRALRNRANATLEREAQILDEVLEGAMRGGVVVVPPLREKVAQRLGKPVALSTIYWMLARNGWRKLAPDTAHPQGNSSAREDWKKKLQGKLDEIVATWSNNRPLRLMFQDEARFGRISDTRYSAGAAVRPDRSSMRW